MSIGKVSGLLIKVYGNQCCIGSELYWMDRVNVAGCKVQRLVKYCRGMGHRSEEWCSLVDQGLYGQSLRSEIDRKGLLVPVAGEWMDREISVNDLT